MAPDRLARIALLPRDKILGTLQAIDLLEHAGVFTPQEAERLREAIRARAAELSEPVGESS